LLRTFVLVVGLALPAYAQDEQGWSFSGRFSGSANSAGVITKADPLFRYTFNRHFSAYAGIPFYFVNLSSTATAANSGFMAGAGNAFLGFRARAESDAVNYTSNLEFSAPTGDKSRGFSTGRVTIDWTHRFSRTFSSLTPFGSVGVANTVADTDFFVRPFSSLGVVTHFEGGSEYDVSPETWLGASAYAVRGSGQQRIVSKIVERGRGNGNSRRVFERQMETVSQAESVNDYGFSTWLGVTPRPGVDFHAGYSRSASYDFNTFFFGIGFHLVP